MAISVFDLFKIGIGPSSSHTVGPMRAAALFVNGLATHQLLEQVAAIKSELFGSLGATGRGHGTDSAVLLGLEGEQPDSIAIDTVTPRVAAIRADGLLHLLGRHPIVFREKEHLLFYRRETLAFHSNGMRFTATGSDGAVLACKTYYSVGGGFVVDEQAVGKQRIAAETSVLPHPFHSGDELLALCHERGCSISQLMLDNEQVWRDEATIRRELLHIWEVMQQCVQRGAQQEGILPGGLHVKRRAAALYRKLCALPSDSLADPLATLDWIGFYALAVNEENASGGRVVTAPTNGAAGIIPAVLHYYLRFIPGANEDGVVRFLLTAAAIGLLYKENASISGAEVGCQGEVGVACSMAAAGLAEVLGGSVAQVENAAEIGMEHNLGLTCDPIGGLVQVPCIERNAMGAVKAVNAARMALNGDGHHHVSLDKVIRTMRQTGADMKTKYKETSRGGLAVNIIEC